MTGERVTASDAPGDGEDSEDGSDRYVHQPRSSPPTQATPSDTDFGWHGWLLVGVIVFAFFVTPIALLYLPQAQSFVSSIGLTLRDAYLVLPLLPAFLLAIVSVWAAVRSRSS